MFPSHDPVRAQDNAKLCAGSSSDLEIFHNGTNSLIDNYTGALLLRNNVSSDNGGNIVIQAKVNEDSIVCNDDGAVELYYNNQKKIETTDTGVRIPDSQKYEVGAGADLLLFHNGTNNYIRSENGTLYIDSSGGEQMVTAIPNGAVELYHDNTKMFETASYGVAFASNVRVNSDSSSLQIGAGQDLKLHHTSNNSYITNDTGYLYVQSDSISLAAKSAGENFLVMNKDAGVLLYYDSVLQFSTTSDGLVLNSGARISRTGNSNNTIMEVTNAQYAKSIYFGG